MYTSVQWQYRRYKFCYYLHFGLCCRRGEEMSDEVMCVCNHLMHTINLRHRLNRILEIFSVQSVANCPLSVWYKIRNMCLNCHWINSDLSDLVELPSCLWINPEYRPVWNHNRSWTVCTILGVHCILAACKSNLIYTTTLTNKGWPGLGVTKLIPSIPLLSLFSELSICYISLTKKLAYRTTRTFVIRRWKFKSS